MRLNRLLNLAFPLHFQCSYFLLIRCPFGMSKNSALIWIGSEIYKIQYHVWLFHVLPLVYEMLYFFIRHIGVHLAYNMRPRGKCSFLYWTIFPLHLNSAIWYGELLISCMSLKCVISKVVFLLANWRSMLTGYVCPGKNCWVDTYPRVGLFGHCVMLFKYVS